ncbi:MAG: adenine deaminase [Chloroflexi bacterium]|nr:adenine deaminase [Chloroflexota bacterium]
MQGVPNAAGQQLEMIDALLGQKAADLVLRGGRVVNVLSGDVYHADVAVKGDRILKIGDASDLVNEKTQVVDVTGRFISPGFIDSHMHFESSMLTIAEFSRLSIPTGTTVLVADPHEIGNVLGLEGIKAMVAEAAHVPNHVYFVVPALTPDTPHLETPGAEITSRDMDELLALPHILGIGEIQGFSNVANVYTSRPEVLKDLVKATAQARYQGKIVEGNAPELYGRELAAHIIASGGDTSCHETTSKAEALEKLHQGMYLYMREGSTERNMAECLRAIKEEGLDTRRAILASDDMVAEDLIRFGHMNDIIRRTIAAGIEPIKAIQMATINPAERFGFQDLGSLASWKLADMVVLSDLYEMKVEDVYLRGKLVAREGKMIECIFLYRYPEHTKNTVKREPISLDELAITASGSAVRVRCIQLIPNQNITATCEVELGVVDGHVPPAVEKDVQAIAVVERHGRGGHIGKGFLHGFGLKRGAIAESVSHDAHNIIVTGTNYEDMVVAVNAVIRIRGGIAIVSGGQVLAELPLPIAGLITDELSGEEVSQKIAEMHRLVREDLDCPLHAPLMHLSFLSLSTSPKWKITDKGLIDVNTFQVLDPVI